VLKLDTFYPYYWAGKLHGTLLVISWLTKDKETKKQADMIVKEFEEALKKKDNED